MSTRGGLTAVFNSDLFWPDFVERPFDAYRAYYQLHSEGRLRGRVHNSPQPGRPVSDAVRRGSRRCMTLKCSARFPTLASMWRNEDSVGKRLHAGSRSHRAVVRNMGGDVALVVPTLPAFFRGARAMASVGCAIARSQRRTDSRNPHRSPRPPSRMDAAGARFRRRCRRRSSHRRIIGFATITALISVATVAGADRERHLWRPRRAAQARSPCSWSRCSIPRCVATRASSWSYAASSHRCERR